MTEFYVQHLEDEVTQLRNIVSEMIPYVVSEMHFGLSLGPPPEGHNDDCSDCISYNNAMLWKERFHSEEFAIFDLGL